MKDIFPGCIFSKHFSRINATNTRMGRDGLKSQQTTSNKATQVSDQGVLGEGEATQPQILTCL